MEEATNTVLTAAAEKLKADIGYLQSRLTELPKKPTTPQYRDWFPLRRFHCLHSPHFESRNDLSQIQHSLPDQAETLSELNSAQSTMVTRFGRICHRTCTSQRSTQPAGRCDHHFGPPSFSFCTTSSCFFSHLFTRNFSCNPWTFRL